MKMTGKKNTKKLSEQEIDNIIISQADNDSEWEEPIYVHKDKQETLSIPSELASRATFLTRLHRETDVGKWLVRIIRERIEIEELAFFEAKNEFFHKVSV